MESREREKLAGILGAEDAAAVERFLGQGCALCTLTEAADQADMDWPEWGRAAAVLQRWLEARQRSSDAARKLGYISCTVESQRGIPLLMRPPLAKAVAEMLEKHGFLEIS